MVTGTIFSRDGIDAPDRITAPDTLGDSILPEIYVAAPIESIPASHATHTATVASDTTTTPSRIGREKVDLDPQVTFSSKDSMILIR